MRSALLIAVVMGLLACGTGKAPLSPEGQICEKLWNCGMSNVPASKECAPFESCYESMLNGPEACQRYIAVVDRYYECKQPLSCDCLIDGMPITYVNGQSIYCGQNCADLAEDAGMTQLHEAARDAGCDCDLSG